MHRQNDHDIVDVETRVTIVERQETIHGQLRTKVVVFTRQNLLAHTVTQLGNKVENGTKTKVTTLTTLVVLRVLDTTATLEHHHTSIDILV